MSKDAPHKPGGTPAGGQFDNVVKTESQVVLGGSSAPKDVIDDTAPVPLNSIVPTGQVVTLDDFDLGSSEFAEIELYGDPDGHVSATGSIVVEASRLTPWPRPAQWTASHDEDIDAYLHDTYGQAAWLRAVPDDAGADIMIGFDLQLAGDTTSDELVTRLADETSAGRFAQDVDSGRFYDQFQAHMAVVENERNQATRAYLEAALWTGTDDDGEPLDAVFDPIDVSGTSREQAYADLSSFMRENRALIDKTHTLRPEYDAAAIGHDFFLTRNGHGAGFWDRGLGDIGDRLTAACKTYGTSDPYLGDDGKVHLT